MAKYYYLVSSLADIVLDGGRRGPGVRKLFLFCMEQMKPKDFEQVRKLFLFNDIKNTTFLYFNKKQKQEDYVLPAYYDEATFNENLQEPQHFLPFLAKFYELKKAGERLYPQLPETDELTSLFYEDLENFTDAGFLRDYYNFELNLRNITTAIAFRKNGLSLPGKLIPCGLAYEIISKNESASDFGLSSEFPFVERLVALSQQSQLLDFEKGEELFNGIMNTIKRSIRFSIEFTTMGDK